MSNALASSSSTAAAGSTEGDKDLQIILPSGTWNLRKVLQTYPAEVRFDRTIQTCPQGYVTLNPSDPHSTKRLVDYMNEVKHDGGSYQAIASGYISLCECSTWMETTEHLGIVYGAFESWLQSYKRDLDLVTAVLNALTMTGTPTKKLPWEMRHALVVAAADIGFTDTGTVLPKWTELTMEYESNFPGWVAAVRNLNQRRIDERKAYKHYDNKKANDADDERSSSDSGAQ